jgi:TolA-binding protein
MTALNKLLPEDIDEKIRLNEQAGVNIYRLRDGIIEEMKDFEWTIIRSTVQCQSYKEQLAHINKRIADMEEVEKSKERLKEAQRVDNLEVRLKALESKDQAYKE